MIQNPCQSLKISAAARFIAFMQFYASLSYFLWVVLCLILLPHNYQEMGGVEEEEEMGDEVPTTTPTSIGNNPDGTDDDGLVMMNNFANGIFSKFDLSFPLLFAMTEVILQTYLYSAVMQQDPKRLLRWVLLNLLMVAVYVFHTISYEDYGGGKLSSPSPYYSSLWLNEDYYWSLTPFSFPLFLAVELYVCWIMLEYRAKIEEKLKRMMGYIGYIEVFVL